MHGDPVVVKVFGIAPIEDGLMVLWLSIRRAWNRILLLAMLALLELVPDAA